MQGGCMPLRGWGWSRSIQNDSECRMRGASQRVWLALTACAGCLLCLHGLFQFQESTISVHDANSAHLSTVSAVDKLPVEPSAKHSSTRDSYHSKLRKTTSPQQLKTDFTNGSIYSHCPNLYQPYHVQETQSFQPVHQGKSWVFSAYFDARYGRHLVKIIGIADVRQDSKPHFCRMWFNHTSEPDVRTVIEDIVPETHGLRFAVFIYTCDLRSNVAPYAVSLVRDRCDTPNVLPVVNNYRKNWTPRSKFTVCGPPFHSKFNDYHQLVEMIEVNGLFGADHYVFYNYSSGANIQAYLKDYQKEGVVDIVQWPLPKELVEIHGQKRGIHYFAQLASLNDCIYRNLYKAKFIAVLDLDELLVPKSFNNWTAVISSLPNRPFPKICSAVFRNTFFRLDWSQPSVLSDRDTSIAKDYGIHSLVTTLREGQIWSHGLRSKYIADTSRLEMAGIHLPWKCLREKYNYDVSTSVALLHHYRSWSGHPVDKNAVQDKSVLRFMENILQRVVDRHRKFRDVL